jgi:general secretion pathway protein D
MKSIKLSFYSALLTLLLSSSSYADCNYELFSISSTKDTKIIDFIDQLSDECEFSVIVSDPNAEQFLNTKLNKTHLNNLTITEVLNIVLGENNLSYTLDNGLLKISYLTTKVFNIDYILSQRKSTGSTDVTLTSNTDAKQMEAAATSTGGSKETSSESGIKIESTDEVKFWEELDKEFQKILNRPEDVYEAHAPVINKNAGLVTVTATLKQMKRFEEYLEKLQNKVQLQVLIDVQLLSVTMADSKSTGIDWAQLYALQDIELSVHNLKAKNVTTFEGDSITEAVYGGMQDTARLVSIKAGGSLKEIIKFLKTQGDVNSISNPKVLTLNNQPALITAGTEYFYKIESSTQQQGSGGGVAATTQNEMIKSIFAGVLLTITPEIADDKTITLIINPSLSETNSQMSANGEERRMPPDLSRRQLSSVVTVKDGNKIILGGLINTKNTESVSKVPLLGSIPGLSYLFSREEMTKEVEELVIVIEPHIIHKENNNLSLSDLGYQGISNEILGMQNADANSTEVNEEDEI